MIPIILRHAYSLWGTFGHLVVEGEWFPTVELPWKLNKRNVSCIPTGYYQLELGQHTSEDGSSYACYEIRAVPDRQNIEIHIGNTMLDLLGCIAIGTRFGMVNGLPGVLNSSAAHARWMEIMADIPRTQFRVLDRIPYDWSEEG